MKHYSFLLSSSCKCYSFIIYGGNYFSILFQSGDHSSCFNDHNYFFKEGVGYFIHWVSYLGLDASLTSGKICHPHPSHIFNFSTFVGALDYTYVYLVLYLKLYIF